VPHLVRLISRRNWDSLPWLTEGEVQADALRDLCTDENMLSVWLVENVETDIDRVIVALASNRQRPDKLDYALINYQDIVNLNIEVSSSLGDTPDSTVNMLHRDLTKMSVTKVAGLARAIKSEETRPERIPAKVIKRLIIEGIDEGYLDRDAIKQTMLDKLGL